GKREEALLSFAVGSQVDLVRSLDGRRHQGTADHGKIVTAPAAQPSPTAPATGFPPGSFPPRPRSIAHSARPGVPRSREVPFGAGARARAAASRAGTCGRS